jgi:hypothetical protein
MMVMLVRTLATSAAVQLLLLLLLLLLSFIAQTVLLRTKKACTTHSLYKAEQLLSEIQGMCESGISYQ